LSDVRRVVDRLSKKIPYVKGLKGDGKKQQHLIYFGNSLTGMNLVRQSVRRIIIIRHALLM